MEALANNDKHLGVQLLEFAKRNKELDSPEQILNLLHDVTFPTCQIAVMGALQLPLRWGEWARMEKGKNVFLHESVPEGWWLEWREHNKLHPGPALGLAQLSIAPFTMTELMRMLEPIGHDRWPFELALKYGMRDSLTCPVGGRWVVGFWSRHVLSQRLTPEARAMLFMGATFAAIGLQRVVRPQADRLGSRASLTPRELAVLRALSFGKSFSEIAKSLGLGEETVRTHIKKAQIKLQAQNRTHAVAQALRLRLIP